MSGKVYIVTSGSYSDYRIERVYLDRDEAYNYVAAHQKTQYSYVNDVEEYAVGAPQNEYEGPVWVGLFQQNRPLKPHPSGLGYFGPRYGDMDEHRGEIEDSWAYYEEWHSGATPPKVAVQKAVPDAYLDTIYARVWGLSRDHVEKSLQDTVARLKAEKAGLT